MSEAGAAPVPDATPEVAPMSKAPAAPVPRRTPVIPPLWLIALLFGFAALRLGVAPLVGLTEDEAYYRLWSLHPQIGYLDHAPLVAWVIAAGRWAMGDSELGVRLFAPLAMLIGSLAVWRSIALIAGARAAALGTVWFNILPLIAAGSIVITPDTPAVLFWGLALWALIERATGGGRRWWLAVGLFAGLGLLSKYTVLFLGPGLLLAVLLHRELRTDLKSWEIWAGGALAIALFSPVIGWNALNDFVSFEKQFGRAGRATGFDPRYLPEWLGATIALFHPIAVLFAGLTVARLVGSGRAALANPLIVVVATSLPLIAYLVYHSLSARVQVNWPSPLVSALIILAAPAAADATAALLVRLRRAAVPIGAAFTVVLYLWAISEADLLEGERDPLNQTRGWTAFSQELETLAAREGVAWIGTMSYATTAQIAFATRARPSSLPVHQLNERIRWAYLPAPDPAVTGQPALIVDLERRLDMTELLKRFASVHRVTTLKRGANGRAGGYAVFRVSDPIAPFSGP